MCILGAGCGSRKKYSKTTSPGLKSLRDIFDLILSRARLLCTRDDARVQKCHVVIIDVQDLQLPIFSYHCASEDAVCVRDQKYEFVLPHILKKMSSCQLHVNHISTRYSLCLTQKNSPISVLPLLYVQRENVI